MESELDLDLVNGESPLLELFLAQMMSVMCCATRVMATESKGGFSLGGRQRSREGKATNHDDIYDRVRVFKVS